MKWAIEGRELKVDSLGDFSEKISYIKDSLKIRHVVVVLDNSKQYTLDLNDYGFGKFSSEISNECKISRTKFLDWAKDVKRIQVSRKQLVVNRSLERDEYDFENEDLENKLDTSTKRSYADVNEDDQETETKTSKHQNERLQLISQQQPVNADEYVVENERDEGAAGSFQKENTDEVIVDDLDRFCIGKNVKVHLKNLVPPAKERQTRELDLEHVKVLEEQFSACSSLNIYTVMIGFADTNIDMKDLKVPGRYKIEVLGGNHTRQALLNAGKEDICVTMDIYTNLTYLQALKLGFQHNEIHKYSKQTSFEETVKLFREIKASIKMKKPNVSARELAMKWRQQIGMLTDTNKTKINKFQTYFHLAMLEEDVWVELEKLFDAWRINKVKDQPAKEMKQTHMFDFFRLKENEEKKRILTALSSGKLSFNDFKAACLKGTSGKSTEKKKDNCREKHPEQKEENKKISVLGNMTSPTRNVVCSDNNNDANNAQKIQEEYNDKVKKELTEKNKVLQEENLTLQNQLNELKKRLCETKAENSSLIDKLKVEITRKNGQIETLTSELNMALDVANRAREQLKEVSKGKIDEKKKTTETSLKKRKESEETKTKDLTVKSKKNRSEDVLIESVATEPAAKKAKTNTEVITEERDTSERTEKDSYHEVALVEYLNKKLYIGILKGHTLTYTRFSIGKLSKDFKLKDKTFLINKKDCQVIDPSYLITKINCQVINNKIILTDDNIINLEDGVKNYIERK